jgi:hypothetical protein
MCNPSNVQEIVSELLTYLQVRGRTLAEHPMLHDAAAQ